MKLYFVNCLMFTNSDWLKIQKQMDSEVRITSKFFRCGKNKFSSVHKSALNDLTNIKE